MKLSENLKRIRKDNNLSQEQLAEKLGVSRQAVSKWESGQSYPEMDKVLLICKLFNYNIDELMNENVKEVNENKQSKININKYIDDFFEYITKTVDMFSSMKFKQKIRCLTEQIVIGLLLFFIFVMIGAIGSSIVYGILGRLPDGIYYTIRSILGSIYLILSIGIGITILLHIFKVRYLDYYEVIKEDDNENIEKDNNKENIEIDKEDSKKKKIFLEKKKEKIVIRDPEHSQSKFLSGIVRIVLWCIKFIVACFALWFIFSFICLITLLVLSFLFVKTGAIFIGTFFVLIAAIIINIIILELSYNFIVSKTSKKNRMAIIFLISLILIGLGSGLVLIGIKDFNFIEEIPNDYIVEDTFEFDMTENLSINAWRYSWDSGVEYIESDSNKIKVVVKHVKYQRCYYNLDSIKNTINIYGTQDNSMVMNFIRQMIDDINNKEFKNYDYIAETKVYASKENIEKLKQNALIKEEQEKQVVIDDLNNSIEELEIKVQDLEDETFETQSTLEEKETVITDLENQITQKDSEIMELQNRINDLQIIIEQQ